MEGIVGDNFKAESGPFTFHHNGADEIREVPFVFVPNLIAKVAEMITSYERYWKSIVYNQKCHLAPYIEQKQALLGMKWCQKIGCGWSLGGIKATAVLSWHSSKRISLQLVDYYVHCCTLLYMNQIYKSLQGFVDLVHLQWVYK